MDVLINYGADVNARTKVNSPLAIQADGWFWAVAGGDFFAPCTNRPAGAPAARPRGLARGPRGDPAWRTELNPPGEDEMAGVGSFSGKTLIHVFKERKIQTIDAKNKMD